MASRAALSVLVVTALSTTMSLAAEPGKARSDQELLQGTWECVSTLKDGKKVKTYVGVRAIFQGNRLTWIFPQPDGTTKTAKAIFTIDPEQSPKHFDWYLEGKPAEVHRRLYTLEGDTLRWSTNLGTEPRPATFDAGQWQFTMRRVPAKK